MTIQTVARMKGQMHFSSQNPKEIIRYIKLAQRTIKIACLYDSTSICTLCILTEILKKEMVEYEINFCYAINKKSFYDVFIDLMPFHENEEFKFFDSKNGFDGPLNIVIGKISSDNEDEDSEISSDDLELENIDPCLNSKKLKRRNHLIKNKTDDFLMNVHKKYREEKDFTSEKYNNLDLENHVNNNTDSVLAENLSISDSSIQITLKKKKTLNSNNDITDLTDEKHFDTSENSNLSNENISKNDLSKKITSNMTNQSIVNQKEASLNIKSDPTVNQQEISLNIKNDSIANEKEVSLSINRDSTKSNAFYKINKESFAKKNKVHFSKNMNHFHHIQSTGVEKEMFISIFTAYEMAKYLNCINNKIIWPVIVLITAYSNADFEFTNEEEDSSTSADYNDTLNNKSPFSNFVSEIQFQFKKHNTNRLDGISEIKSFYLPFITKSSLFESFLHNKDLIKKYKKLTSQKIMAKFAKMGISIKEANENYCSISSISKSQLKKTLQPSYYYQRNIGYAFQITAIENYYSILYFLSSNKPIDALLSISTSISIKESMLFYNKVMEIMRTYCYRIKKIKHIGIIFVNKRYILEFNKPEIVLKTVYDNILDIVPNLNLLLICDGYKEEMACVITKCRLEENIVYKDCYSIDRKKIKYCIGMIMDTDFQHQ